VTSLSLLLVLEVVDELLDERSLVLAVQRPSPASVLAFRSEEEGQKGDARSRLNLGVNRSGGLSLGSATGRRPRSETGEAVDTEGDVLVEDLLACCRERRRKRKRWRGREEKRVDLRKGGGQYCDEKIIRELLSTTTSGLSSVTARRHSFSPCSASRRGAMKSLPSTPLHSARPPYPSDALINPVLPVPELSRVEGKSRKRRERLTMKVDEKESREGRGSSREVSESTAGL
jgi:hypothetical protein